MKTLLALAILVASPLHSHASAPCKCTTNWIHVLIYAGASTGPWSPVSSPKKIVDYWIQQINCGCTTGAQFPNPAPPPLLTMTQPTLTNTPPTSPPFSIPGPNAGSILSRQYVDPYAMSNNLTPPYFQSMTTFAIERSTNAINWTREIEFTNWNGMGTSVCLGSYHGTPMFTNEITSDTLSFQSEVCLTVNVSTEPRGYFRLVTP